MNSLDYFIIVLLLLFLVKGLVNGLIKELFSLLSILIGATASYFFADDVVATFSAYWPEVSSYKPLVYLVLFLLIAFLITYLGKLLTKAAKYVALGFLNRLLGGLFGLLKGAFTVIIIWVLFAAALRLLDLKPPSYYSNSLFVNALIPLFDFEDVLTGNTFDSW